MTIPATAVADLRLQNKAVVFFAARLTNPQGLRRCDVLAVKVSTIGERGTIASQNATLTSKWAGYRGNLPMRFEVAPGSYAIDAVGCRNAPSKIKTEFTPPPGKSFATFSAAAGEAIDLGVLTLDSGDIDGPDPNVFGSEKAQSSVLIFIDDLPEDFRADLNVTPPEALITRHMVATSPPTAAQISKQCEFHRSVLAKLASSQSNASVEHVCSRMSKTNASLAPQRTN